MISSNILPPLKKKENNAANKPEENKPAQSPQHVSLARAVGPFWISRGYIGREENKVQTAQNVVI